MLLYGIIIFVSMALIVGANYLLALPAAQVGQALPAVVLSTVAVILLDGWIAFLLRRLPARIFDGREGLYAAGRKECRFYRRLGVQRWRNKIPELGIFTGFRKNRVYRPNDNDYIARFILECEYGIIIHLADAIFGFLIIFLCPLSYAPGIGIPVCVVNFVLNLLPLFVLRYNIPKLRALAVINARHEEKKETLA